MRRYRFPLDVFAALVVAALVGMSAEAWWAWAAHPGALSAAEAHRILGSLSRSHTQLVAVIFICIAVAVPVTASQYTAKLLRVFLADRLHVVVLSAYALAAAHANWVLFLSRERAVSEAQVATVLVTSVVAFVCVVPYFFHVIRFLEPHSLVERIEAQAARAIARALAGPGEARTERAKSDLSHALRDLGSLVLKSLDGMGRESAALGIVGLRSDLAAYGVEKGGLPSAWFEARKEEFRGLSREALQFTTVERCWVEVLALRELGRAFDAALFGLPDSVVLIADTVRGIGEDAEARDDLPVLDNAVRAMNSMLRSAINAKNPRAIFDVLLQYEALAEQCLGRRPERTAEIAGYYAYYGVRARNAGLEFIPELFLYDLGALLRTAAEGGSGATSAVLDGFDDLAARLSAEPTPILGCAVLVTLGSARDTLDPAMQARLLDRLFTLPAAVIDEALGVLDRAESPRFHELSSRQVDVNFLPPQAVEALRAMVADRRR